VKAHQSPCSAAISHLPLKTYRDVSVTRPATNLPRHVADWELRLLCARFMVNKIIRRVPAMDDAEQPSPELYRLAQKLRELADQSHLPDIQGDLRQLAARFDRMAAYLEAQRRLGAARSTHKD
jgi:hypothetical protein